VRKRPLKGYKDASCKPPEKTDKNPELIQFKVEKAYLQFIENQVFETKTCFNGCSVKTFY